MARSFTVASSQFLSVTFTAFTAEPVSLSARFSKTSLGVEQAIFSIANSTDTTYHSLHISTSNFLYALTGPGAVFANSLSTISAATWYHGLAVFASDTDRRVYLNGVRGTDNTTNASVSSFNTVKIGVTADSTPFGYWGGNIAEAAIWNVVLTDAEAAVLAKGISPLAVRPENLVFYAPLVRDADRDVVGGLSLTANAAPTIAVHPPVFYSFPSSLFPGAGTADVANLPAGSFAVNNTDIYLHYGSQ